MSSEEEVITGEEIEEYAALQMMRMIELLAVADAGQSKRIDRLEHSISQIMTVLAEHEITLHRRSLLGRMDD